MKWELAGGSWTGQALLRAALLVCCVTVSGCVVWRADASSGCSNRCGWVDECQCMCKCDSGEICSGGWCVTCSPYCGSRECGGDGCGGSCGGCVESEICSSGGKCLDPELLCAGACADGDCGVKSLEGKECDCGNDCPEGEACNTTLNKCECVPVCFDEAAGVPYECGHDSCEGNCGECEYGDCIDHVCFCEQDCEGKSCGSDGCGGVCPNLCAEDAWCYEFQCAEQCDHSETVFSPDATKVVSLVFGKGGHPGEALDVDRDPDTCSPAGDCQGGLDNAASGILGNVDAFVDADALAEEWLEGDLVLLKELVDPTWDGQPFTFRVYHGQKVYPEGECDDSLATCPYYASFDSFHPLTCEVYNVFDNAVIEDGRLRAGGKGYAINIVFRDEAFMGLEATLHQVVLEAEVLEGPGGLSLVNGVTGGAVRKQALLEAVYMVPEEDRVDWPVGLDMIRNLLDMFLESDLDLDGDGELDAISYGVRFSTVPANIVGVSPENVWGIGLF